MKIRFKRINKRAATLIAAALVIITVCASVIAYQTTITDDVVNEVKSQKLNASIDETITGSIKEEIIIEADDDNTEDAYVRVSLIANWVDESDSSVIYTDPVPDLNQYVDTDKWIPTEIPVEPNSVYTNTYYVYHKALSPGQKTDNILKTPIELVSESGKKLEITVLMQAADKETFEGSVMS